MIDSFLRCAESDYDAMIDAGISAKAFCKSKDSEGNMQIIGSNFDYIGPVLKATGQMVTVRGHLVEETKPILDPNGIPYWHVNLRSEEGFEDTELAPWLIPKPLNPFRDWL